MSSEDPHDGRRRESRSGFSPNAARLGAGSSNLESVTVNRREELQPKTCKPFVAVCTDGRPCRFRRYCGKRARWTYRHNARVLRRRGGRWIETRLLMSFAVCDRHLRTRFETLKHYPKSCAPANRAGENCWCGLTESEYFRECRRRYGSNLVKSWPL